MASLLIIVIIGAYLSKVFRVRPEYISLVKEDMFDNFLLRLLLLLGVLLD